MSALAAAVLVKHRNDFLRMLIASAPGDPTSSTLNSGRVCYFHHEQHARHRPKKNPDKSGLERTRGKIGPLKNEEFQRFEPYCTIMPDGSFCLQFAYNLASRHFAKPRQTTIKNGVLSNWCRWWDSNPHDFLGSQDFKSCASAISPHRRSPRGSSGPHRVPNRSNAGFRQQSSLLPVFTSALRTRAWVFVAAEKLPRKRSGNVLEIACKLLSATIGNIQCRTQL